MNDTWKDLGNRGPETYEEALARCEVLKPDAGLTDEEKAEKRAFEKAMLTKHDHFFAEQYMETASGTPVSKYLARQLGSAYDPEDDEGDLGGLK